MERKVQIKLHGYLKDLYPYDIELSGSSVAEVINGLCRQTKAFNVGLNEEKHHLRVHGFDTEESLFAPIPEDVEVLHIMPDIRGGKGGGFFKIAIGVVLVAAAFVIPGAGLALPGVLGATGATFGSVLFGVGLNLILGGLLQLLSPSPEIDSKPVQQDPEASKYLGANQNTVKIGTRIPLLYGKHPVYGHYLSFNVDAKEVSA